MRLAALLLLASAGLVGCAGPGVVGETEFSCPGYPSHPTCMSVRDLYQATEASDQVVADETGKASKAVTNTPQVLGGAPKPTQAEQVARVSQQAAKARQVQSLAARPAEPAPVPRVDDPVPIRTPAQVMRIWVAPWEDEAGDLHVSGYVYTEVEKRRWMIGERAVGQESSVRPLQIEHRKSPAGSAVQARGR